jgi:hypothetical protein
MISASLVGLVAQISSSRACFCSRRNRSTCGLIKDVRAVRRHPGLSSSSSLQVLLGLCQQGLDEAPDAIMHRRRPMLCFGHNGLSLMELRRRISSAVARRVRAASMLCTLDGSASG